MFIPVILTEVLCHPSECYLVISGTDNIHKFFNFLSIPNVIFHPYGYNIQRDGRFAFVKEKKHLLTFVSQFEIGQVVFFHAEFGGMANWLIRKLSKSIPIKYCKLYDSMPAPKAKLSLKVLKLMIRERLLWGQKMDILMGTYPFPSLPEEFFRRVKAEEIEMHVDNVLINSFLSEKLKTFRIEGKYVLLTGTAVHNGWYTEQKYIPFINDLISVLGKDNVVSKCHPRYKDLYGLECDIAQVPSFIPGNVLLNSFDFYIGCESTLLVEAAKAGKTSISYIDWVSPHEEQRQFLHAFFENRLQGKGVIHFPKSEEDLLKIILPCHD